MSSADFGRIIHISKRRERAKEDVEQQKQKLEEEKNKITVEINQKFTSHSIKKDEMLKGSTAGLVTLDEMKSRHKELLQAGDNVIIGKKDEQGNLKKKEAEVKNVQKRVLSFDPDEGEDDEAPVVLKKRVGMNPSVDTSFLPDKEREKETVMKREELVKEWRELQEKEKNEYINVAWSYWDGSAHMKEMKVKKGDTIGEFLARAIEVLRKEFSELKPASPENLMFIKEDLIIPHFYTFLDFIATKMMGKTGPLWEFDCVGEIRVRQDAALDGESHPSKVVMRSWFEKNKHIYPASRWEAFVPKKEYKRTIDDLTTI